MLDKGEIKVLFKFFFLGVIIKDGVLGFKNIFISVLSVKVYCNILYNLDIKG